MHSITKKRGHTHPKKGCFHVKNCSVLYSFVKKNYWIIVANFTKIAILLSLQLLLKVTILPLWQLPLKIITTLYFHDDNQNYKSNYH